jgi:hypothetical protein
MDDVETIEKFGVDETFIFVADSAKRDKAAYPTAAEYEVYFNAQFRNVVKFEVLKVNIPRTDYLVDETECTISYAINQPTSIATWQQEIQGNIRTASIAPGDYNLPQLIDELNSVLQQTAAAFNDTVVLEASPTTNPSEISNKINITGSGPFALLGDNSTIQSTLGFGDPVNAAQAAATGYYSVVPGYTVNYPNGAANVFLSVPGNIPGAQSTNVFVGTLPPGDNSSFVPILENQIPSQYFTASAPGVPASVMAYFQDLGPAPPGGFASNVVVRQASDDSVLAFGNIVSINSQFTPSVSDQLTVLSPFVQGVQYYVQFLPLESGGSESNCTSLWYAFPNLPPSEGAYMQINNANVFPGQSFSTDVTAGAIGNYLTSPGIVNLRGARYIKIRCKELEQLIYRDRIGEPSTAGVGIVHIIGYGYAESRYDFSSIPVRPFHPIGKLQKLTFRLERPDGTLYETNGVDNTLLCALTFRTVPNNSVNKTFDGPGKYPAAPMYTGDYIQLQQNRWNIEARATYPTTKVTYDRCRPAS